MSAPADAAASATPTLCVVDVCGALHTVCDEASDSAAPATFTTLVAPDRRPHPFCARSLLARIDARARTIGARVVVSADVDASSYAAPLSVADALVRGATTGGALTLALVEDVELLANAASTGAAASSAFAEAVARAKATLVELAASPLELGRTEAGAVCVHAAQWSCGPHVLLAALIAAGTRADASEPSGDIEAELRALLGDAVVEARARGRAEFPGGVLREDVSFPPR